MGKTLASAIPEVEKCAVGFRHYARQGPGMLAPQTVETGSSDLTAR